MGRPLIRITSNTSCWALFSDILPGLKTLATLPDTTQLTGSQLSISASFTAPGSNVSSDAWRAYDFHKVGRDSTGRLGRPPCGYFARSFAFALDM